MKVSSKNPQNNRFFQLLLFPDLPKLVSELDLAAHSDNDSDEEGWEETEEQSEPTKCLFCDNMENSIDDALLHLQDSHYFSLAKLKEKFQMDQYSFIKVSDLMCCCWF